MGIVLKQSLKNTVITYAGFALGAINVLFLYTHFLTDEYHGLVAYVLSTANIMMPIFALGVHNTIIKFYSGYKTRNNSNSFLTLMVLLPLVIIIPVGIIGTLSYEWIADLLSSKNTIIKNHVWLIYAAGICLSYFEVFYAWAKVQLQSVVGNFLKEVFHRIGIMGLFVAIYFDAISVDSFIYGIIIIYLIRTLCMMLYAFNVRRPVFRLGKLPNLERVIKYTLLIIIAGSVTNVILEIDKTMLGNFISIENVAYYGVAIYIATTIGVPSRAMYQITNPLTAKFLNDNDEESLKSLYKKSSINLLIVSGLILVLIVINLEEFYSFIKPAYATAINVVLIVGLAKLSNNIIGNANAILFNSDYYRIVLFLGIFLALLAIILNALLIPVYGIYGAAIATFTAIFIYNLLKVVYVQRKFKMHPFTANTFKTLFVIVVFVALSYFVDLDIHPVLSIAIKSSVVGVLYVLIVYKWQLSEDIVAAIDRLRSR